MKKVGLLVGSVGVLTFPSFAFALAEDATGGVFGDLLANIVTFTDTVLIPFILAIGFLVFVWGMFQYFIAGGANDEKKEAGKSLMIYATLGFVLIIVFWGVVNLLAGSTGLEGKNLEDTPKSIVAPGAGGGT